MQLFREPLTSNTQNKKYIMKYLKSYYWIVMMLSSVMFASCIRCDGRWSGTRGSQIIRGDNIAAREERNVEKFDMLEFDGVANVYFAQAPKCQVVIKADKNILPYIETKVVNNKLEITTKPHISIRPKTKMEILVYSPDIKQIEWEGVGSLYVPGKLNVSDLQVHSEGVGSLNFLGTISARSLSFHMEGVGSVKATNINCNSVKAHLEGVGSITLSGVTKRLIKYREGVGSVNTDGLKVLASTSNVNEDD